MENDLYLMPTLKKPQKNKTKSFNRKERIEIYNSSKWRKLRLSHLLDHPLCELCQKEGKTVPAIDVHHIISFMSTTDPLKRLLLAYNPDNLMSLCKECHQKVHNETQYKPINK